MGRETSESNSIRCNFIPQTRYVSGQLPRYVFQEHQQKPPKGRRKPRRSLKHRHKKPTWRLRRRGPRGREAKNRKKVQTRRQKKRHRGRRQSKRSHRRTRRERRRRYRDRRRQERLLERPWLRWTRCRSRLDKRRCRRLRRRTIRRAALVGRCTTL